MNCVDFALIDLQMCQSRVMHYADCGHQSSADYSRCPAALVRPGQKPCVPPSGNIATCHELWTLRIRTSRPMSNLQKDNPSKLCRFAIMEVTKLVDVGRRVQLGTESEDVPTVVCTCSTAPREIFGKSFCLLVVLLIPRDIHKMKSAVGIRAGS